MKRMMNQDPVNDIQLQSLSKEELVAKCEALLQKNKELEQKVENSKKKLTSLNVNLKSKGKRHNQRPIDFSQYEKKRLAFRFMYLGWKYQGFASQENTTNTIEEELFIALKKGKLIEDRSAANYSRCGRTDKGVSAFGQVIALDVRGNKKEQFRLRAKPINNDDETISKTADKRFEEIPYIKSLNRLLPPDIRILAHAHVSDDFDARFSCKTRTYKYFFPASNLDIQLMHNAAQKLVGEKDFRNFCKVDVGNNINHFIRNIVSFDVRKLQNSQSERDMCEMEITGLAFLWHQVRCMASVLFLIGLHHEEPEIIDYLLDVERCPKRPQYGIASDIPLVLYDCTFDDVEWIYENDTIDQNISKLEQFWVERSVQAAGLQAMIDCLHSKRNQEVGKERRNNPCITSLLTGYTSKDYKSLKERAVCEGLDRHLEKQAAKRMKLEEKHVRNNLEEKIQLVVDQ